MAIVVDGARLESGVGSASFNGTSLTRIDKDATTVWLAPNDSKTCCCAKFLAFTGICRIQFGDDTVNDEIVLKMHIDYDPNLSMTYELCACVCANMCYCYNAGPGAGMQCGSASGSWCGSLGCKTIASGQCHYGCWDTEAHQITASFPNNVCNVWNNGGSIKLKLINHTMGVESDWENWSTSSTQTHFYM